MIAETAIELFMEQALILHSTSLCHSLQQLKLLSARQRLLNQLMISLPFAYSGMARDMAI